MKKIISAILILVIVVSCEYKLHKTKRKLNTLSIRESKEMNLFSHAYNSIDINLNDSIEFKVIEAWCEKSFNYTDLTKENKTEKSIQVYHLVIVIDKELGKEYIGFQKNWNFSDMDFGQSNGKNYLISYARELISYRPLPDSIEVKLKYSTPPDNPNDFRDVHRLGSFYLTKENK